MSVDAVEPLQTRASLRDPSLRTLKAAAGSWFVVAALGQLIFATYVLLFYGRAAVHGDLASWNKVLATGYKPGDALGNTALAVHLFMAVVITVGGPLQLIPKIRSLAPAFHRWNGRLYMITAFLMSLTGLYRIWFRGAVGDLGQHLGISLNAVLILLFAVLATRTAMARDFRTHRRWALRLFLAVNGVWFFRIGLMLSFLVFQRPFGFNPDTFQGPFLTFLAFAQCLLPLAVLELYLRAQEDFGRRARFATAAGIFVLTAATSGGVAMATLGMWLPHM